MKNQPISSTNSLILAIDGSEHAATAIQLIRNLPIPQACKITIITVLIPRDAQHHAALKSLLEQTQTLFQQDGRKIETELLTGYPAEQIIQYAAKHKSDLLVLGAKGLRGTIRILLGGVAQQVVEYADCPVLIVRTPHNQVNRALLVTDGSEHSQYAVQHLHSCPLPPGADLQVIHVLPPEMTTEMLYRSWPYGIDVIPPVISSEVDEGLATRSKEEEDQGKALLQKTLDMLTEMGIQARTILRRGDAATEILEYAQSEQIDLIIVGSRGLSQMRNLLLGSVSSKIIHYAHCSVLVVKKPRSVAD